MRRGTMVGAVLAGVLAGSPAWAQEGLATTSSIAGHNTIQQAPSGGRAGAAANGGVAAGGTQGAPTGREREIERRNNAATQICKGC